MLPDSAYGMIPHSEFIKKHERWLVMTRALNLGVFAVFLMLAYGTFLSFDSDSWLVLHFESQATPIIAFGGGSVAFLVILVRGVSDLRATASEAIAVAATYYDAAEYKEHARVASKMISPLAEHLSEFHIAFDFANGQRKSFTVDAQQYNTLFQGEVGVLIYKQNGEHLFFGQFTSPLQPSASTPVAHSHSRQQW